MASNYDGRWRSTTSTGGPGLGNSVPASRCPPRIGPHVLARGGLGWARRRGSARVWVLAAPLGGRRGRRRPVGVAGRPTVRSRWGSAPASRGSRRDCHCSRQPELWVPFALNEDDVAARGRRFGTGTLVRLRGGFTRGRVSRELEAIASVFHTEHPEVYRTTRTVPVLTPLREEVLGEDQSWVVMLSVSVGLLLVIACANVAGLFIGRGAARASRAGHPCGVGSNRRAYCTFALCRQPSSVCDGWGDRNVDCQRYRGDCSAFRTDRRRRTGRLLFWIGALCSSPRLFPYLRRCSMVSFLPWSSGDRVWPHR